MAYNFKINVLALSLQTKCIFDIFIYLFYLFLVFNATFNNMLVISWRSVLLVEETGENHLSQVTDKRYHIMYTSL